MLIADSKQAIQSRPHQPWRIWASWVFVSATSGALIGGLGNKLEFIAPLVVVLVLGVGQALVLRQHLRYEACWFWIGASLLGWFLDTNLMLLVWLFTPLTQNSRGCCFHTHRARRRYCYDVCRCRAMACAASASVALPLVFGLTSGAALSLGVAWACYSVVTGVVIVRILNHDVAFPFPAAFGLNLYSGCGNDALDQKYVDGATSVRYTLHANMYAKR